MKWTPLKIAELAPNNLVLEKAKRLAAPRRWEELAGNGSLIWGICKSSGERSYHTMASLDGSAFRCDCREHYHPCRHILALLLRFARTMEAIPLSNALPGWVDELKRQPAHNELTAEAQAARAEERRRRFGQRLVLMEQGIAELEQWLLDLSRQGLAVLESQPPSFWDNFASRMVDAKLGGAARRIRTFGAIMQEPLWHGRLLGELASLYLFTQSFKQAESLPDVLQEELLSVAGVSVKKEEVLQRKGLTDNWLVVGQAEGDSESDNLRYRRTWLLGEQSRRMALLLDFAWGRQAYEAHWIVGSAVRGEMIFYPGAYPLRALIRKASPYTEPFQGWAGYEDLAVFADAYAEALAANPWQGSFPCLLASARSYQANGSLWVDDGQRQRIALDATGHAGWKFLALSGGQGMPLFGEWDGTALIPLSAITNGRVVALHGPVEIPESLRPGPV